MMEENKYRPVTDAKRTDDGHLLFSVPTSPLPESERLAFARSHESDPNSVLDVVLTFPRHVVGDYAAFLAKYGSIDREPTKDELDRIMQVIGSCMADMQVAVMNDVTSFLLATLGDGDKDAARERTLTNIASEIANEHAKRTGADAAEAQANRDRMKEALSEWAKRVKQGDADFNDAPEID